MRVLVCGGREYQDRERLFLVLDQIHAQTPVTCLIEGGASGADCLASVWAVLRSIATHERYDALWASQGRVAGVIRNKRMLDIGKPDLVVAFPGDRGTADMVRRSVSAKVRVMKIE